MRTVPKAFAVGVLQNNEKAGTSSRLTVRSILAPAVHEDLFRSGRDFDTLAKRNKRSFDRLNDDPLLRKRLLGRSLQLGTPDSVLLALGTVVPVQLGERSKPDSEVMTMMATLGSVRPGDLQRELEGAQQLKPHVEALPMPQLGFAHMQRVVISVQVAKTPYALELVHHTEEGHSIGSIRVIFMPAIFSQ
jgi:hypothetical protein